MFDLSAEKPARIEGALIESIFIDRFISPFFKQSSSGWWFTKSDSGKFVSVKLYHNDQTITTTDRLVASRLSSHPQISKSIFAFADLDGFKWSSFDSLGDETSFEEVRQKLKVLDRKRKRNLAKLTYQEAQRLNLAISEIKSRGILEKVSIERDFANNYLNDFSWDIDCFVIYKENVIAFEVKQKYPTLNGIFGLNEGLINLFSMMNDLTIPVWHVVLTKPIWDKDYPATRLLTDGHLSRKAIWIGTKIDLRKLKSGEVSYSPKHTSLYNDTRMSFKKIRCTDFYVITDFVNGDSRKICDLIEGKCQGIKALGDIPKISSPI